MDLSSFISGATDIATKDDHQKVQAFLGNLPATQSKIAADKFLQLLPSFIKNRAYECTALLVEVSKHFIVK